ncbi:MAG: TatD family nuclease-associated radical SAM protein [Defluviitaleaceae bacterium]|nr:TatD family nuclease-associated radical SAM protein [Defluviitaleaceae bacterium]
MTNILYRIKNSLFVNITNACPCDCVFCIRNFSEGMNEGESLWLDREPTIPEVQKAYTTRADLTEIEEVVFCGYGEPMQRPDDVIALAKFFKESDKRVRINTNGLVRLIHPTFEIARLQGVVDTVSISLNADDAEEYNRVTRPIFGIKSYQEMLSFARDAKKYTNVTLSIVGVIEKHRIDNCRQIARDMGVNFRVR